MSNIANLITTLVNSHIQATNPALFQTIKGLITNSSSLETTLGLLSISSRSDLSIALTFGTAAERSTYIPSPPPATLLLFWETDNLALYAWDGSWHLITGTGITQLTGDVTAGPGSGSQVATVVSKAIYQAQPSDPTGTSNTSGLMMGLAGSITPVRTSRIMIIISGNLTNSTATAGNGAKTAIRYGTGSAPANASALTGTQLGNIVSSILERNTSDLQPFSIQGIASGLTPGTAYWIDTSVAAIVAGTGQIKNLSITALEV